MLTKLLLAAGGVFAAGVCAYVALAVYSHRTPSLGLVDGRLRPCPDRPNCVVTEGGRASVDAVVLPGDGAAGWSRFVASVERAGGTVRHDDGEYLHATFESRWLRFVDDLEARLDADAGVIHLRSASRVGYSDRGVNQARLEQLRRSLQTGN